MVASGSCAKQFFSAGRCSEPARMSCPRHHVPIGGFCGKFNLRRSWYVARGYAAMTELSRLPPGERETRDRELAKDTDKLAAKAAGGTRQAYKLIAEQWHKLADEVVVHAK